MAEKHEIKIHRSTEGSYYAYQAVCSCQWQAYASTEEIAEIYGNNHAYAKAMLAVKCGIPQGR